MNSFRFTINIDAAVGEDRTVACSNRIDVHRTIKNYAAQLFFLQSPIHVNDLRTGSNCRTNKFVVGFPRLLIPFGFSNRIFQSAFDSFGLSSCPQCFLRSFEPGLVENKVLILSR